MAHVNARKAISLANKHRLKIDEALLPLNEALASVVDDAYIFYQESDGWVIFFNGDYNTPTGSVDFDKLLNMNTEEAVEYLKARTI